MYHSWIRRTPGCARSTTTTTCTWNWSPPGCRGGPTAAGRGVSSAWGENTLHGALQRCGGARHRVDLERDRQGPVRDGPGRRQFAQGLPAQPPHLPRTAIRRRPYQQLGPGHGPGRLVRRTREPAPCVAAGETSASGRPTARLLAVLGTPERLLFRPLKPRPGQVQECAGNPGQQLAWSSTERLCVACDAYVTSQWAPPVQLARSKTLNAR